VTNLCVEGRSITVYEREFHCCHISSMPQLIDAT